MRTNESGQAFAFDGWKNSVKLTSSTPPLMIAWSNPKKCKLTDDVRLRHC